MSKFDYIDGLPSTHNLFFCNNEKQMFQMLNNDSPISDEVTRLKINPELASQLSDNVVDIVLHSKQTGFCRSVTEMSLIVKIYIIFKLSNISCIHMIHEKLRFSTFRLAKKFTDIIVNNLAANNIDKHVMSNFNSIYSSYSVASNSNVSHKDINSIPKPHIETVDLTAESSIIRVIELSSMLPSKEGKIITGR